MNSINPIIIKLLENRGIKTQEDILEFLSLNPKKTYDPFLLYNMKEAIDLIENHLNDNRINTVHFYLHFSNIIYLFVMHVDILLCIHANLFPIRHISGRINILSIYTYFEM